MDHRVEIVIPQDLVQLEVMVILQVAAMVTMVMAITKMALTFRIQDKVMADQMAQLIKAEV